MVQALNFQLDEVVRLKRTEAGAVLSEALRDGLKQLYVDAVIEAHLRGEFTRAQAVERVGESTIAPAEQEWHAVRDDVAWGLRGRE